MHNMDKPGWMWIPIIEEQKKKLEVSGYSEFRNTVSYNYMTDKGSKWYGYPNTIEGIKGYYSKLATMGIELKTGDSLDGNPTHIVDKHKVITQDLITTAEEFDFLDKNLGLKRIKSIVEIGCGYGRTCRYILANYPDIKYTIVDVQPTIDICREFLTKNIKSNDITFLSPSQFIDSKEDYDLAITISVFFEIDKDQRLNYFKKINEKSVYFYYKDRSINVDEFSSYRWALLKSQPSRTTSYMSDNLFSIND